MRTALIPKKKKGEFRKIYIPSAEEKDAYREILVYLQVKEKNLVGSNIHGFVCGRNCITNAKEHIGYKFTTCFDLKDFFDTVTQDHLNKFLTKEEIDKVLVDGIAGQGLPTSPTVANIGAIKMDQAINRWISKSSLNIVYTRYADDLSFSYNEVYAMKALVKKIPEIVRNCGFSINPNKTRTQSQLRGRRVITGISVGETDMKVPRRILKKIRAAEHQNNKSSLRGLLEYAKLKEPAVRKNEVLDIKVVQQEYIKLINYWGVYPNPEQFPILNIKPNKNLTHNVCITYDPIYKMAPANWGPHCHSCLEQAGGVNRKRIIPYPLLNNVGLAIITNNNEVFSNCGVERPVLMARCYVFTDINNKKWYGRIYGNYNYKRVLNRVLKSHGYKSLETQIKVYADHPIYNTYKDSYYTVEFIQN